MDDKAVFAKTEKGWAEIKSRALKLDRVLRFLLISTDGNKTVATLAQQYGLNGRVGPLIGQLLELGLITPFDPSDRAAFESAALSMAADTTDEAAAVGKADAADTSVNEEWLLDEAATESQITPAADVDAAAAGERFDRALRFLHESAPELMGRDAPRFLARLSLCGEVAHVVPLIPEFRASVGKRNGYAAAEVAVRRLLDILGPLPPELGIIR